MTIDMIILSGMMIFVPGHAMGFLDILRNEAIRIGMPPELQKFDQALRLIGYGPRRASDGPSERCVWFTKVRK